MIVISKYLVPKGYRGLTIFPFIILKSKNYKHDLYLMNHEKIHIRQQLELLIIPFFILYVFEFLVRLIICKNWNKAYKNISFEREAYEHETNLHFLKTRAFWNFIAYF